MASFEERLKEAREKAKKLDGPTSWQATKTNTFQQTIANDLNKTGNTLVQQQRNQKSAQAAARTGGSLMQQATVETPKQSSFKTAFDVIDRGAGYFNQGIASTVDLVANALPRLEGAVFGTKPEATFTGQILKPVTDATGKFKDWVDQTVSNIDRRVQNDTKDSGAASIAANLGSQAVAALPNAVLAFLSGGGSAATQLAAQTTGISGLVTGVVKNALLNPLTGLSFAQTLGQGYEEAKASGANDVEAMTAATLSSLFNAAIETGGGIETLPGEIRGKDLSTGKKAWEWFKSALEEGGEEVVQSVITNMTNKGIFDADKPLVSTTDENAVVNPYRMLQEFGSGAAVGGILGGGQMLGNALMGMGNGRIATPPAEVRNDSVKPTPQRPTVESVMPTVQPKAAKPNPNQKWEKFFSKNNGSPSAMAFQNFSGSLSDADSTAFIAYLDEQEKAGNLKWRGDGTPVMTMPADDHIDNRDYGSVGDPKVKSFQYNNPELQPFMQEGLQILADDLDHTLPGERYYNGIDPNGVGSQGLWSGQKRHTSPEIAMLKDDFGMSYEAINKAMDDLAQDAGRENNANAKRLELVIDQILTHGHRTLGGTEFPPNQAYIEAKGKIAGAKPIQQQTETEVEELPMMPGYGEVQDAKPAMGAADAGFDPYSHASIEYGAIEPGENPARVVDVPKSVDGESNVMQTVRTIMEADATPDAAIPGLEEAIVKGQFSKMPITDQAASERAEATIRRVGYQQALADWRAEVRSGKVSKDSVAAGETLYNAAVNAGDMKSAVKIAVELSTQVRSAAQALQAIRMLKKMSPSAQLYGVKQSVDNLQKTLTDKYGKRAPNLEINEELAAKFLEAETEADRKAAEEALYKDIAKQIPATFADKWNAWRYLSMLGNVRTHVRNIAGNAMFAPVRFVKNKVGAVMEAGAQAVGLIDQSQRTKAFGAAGKDLMGAAKADYENVKQQVLSAGKYNSSSDIIEENRRIFNNVVLETLRQGNSKALEAEDSFFSKGAYASSLASYLKAQGFTAADFTGNGMTAKQKDAARAYAIKEAQKATYRDINGFSEAISSIGFKKPGDSKTKHTVNAIVEGVMPFKKTPANILVRGMEYSPAGLAKALFLDSRQVKNGEITAAEYMDHLASGLTGSGLFALGWLLSNAGLLVGGTPEDEEQAELEGRQPYALEIGGKSITLDWLAPEAMPVFMGVELAEAIREGGGDASLTDKVLSFIKGLSGPMLEMSMMSSLQEALEATEYADNKLLAFMANGALGYLKQAQPTLFGQLERSLESSVRQTTFTQEGDKYLNKDVQYMVGSAANKIPFYDYSQVPYIDAWGRTEDLGGTGERLFNNMLNPAYVSDIQETPVDVEIKRLEDALGVNLTPSRAEKTLTINKEKIILTADEYSTYAQAKGQNDLTFRQNLIDSSLYAELDDATKAKAMEKSKELANVLAIQEAGFKPNMTEWQKDLIDADATTVTRVLVAKALESQAGIIDKQEGKKDKTQQDYFTDMLNDLNATAAQKRQFWVDVGYAKSTCPY